jgi:catechol 2,3-dioxygenase-like lactoylglutathione lyase family enzyme
MVGNVRQFLSPGEGPGMMHGAWGQGKAVYFRDPSEHLLEIKTY